jgi:hypothetical protein
MAERILKSPGVTTRELDLSAPAKVRPQGVPAGVIGTASKGPAFVPTVFATANDFVSIFGDTMGVHQGVMGMKEWMRNARSGLFLRTLGVGNAQEADADGVTSRAGFIVGSDLVDYTQTGLESEGSVWTPGVNPFATDPATTPLESAISETVTAGSVGQNNVVDIFFDYDVDGHATSLQNKVWDIKGDGKRYIVVLGHDTARGNVAGEITSVSGILAGNVNIGVDDGSGNPALVDIWTVTGDNTPINNVYTFDPTGAVFFPANGIVDDYITQFFSGGFNADANNPFTVGQKKSDPNEDQYDTFTLTLAGGIDGDFAADGVGITTIRTYEGIASNLQLLPSHADLVVAATADNISGGAVFNQNAQAAVDSVLELDFSDTVGVSHGSTVEIEIPDGNGTTKTIFFSSTGTVASTGGDIIVDVDGVLPSNTADTVLAALQADGTLWDAGNSVWIGWNLVTVTSVQNVLTLSFTTAGGTLSATVTEQTGIDQVKGSTYFLSAPMKTAAVDQDYMANAKTDTLRGVIMFPNGVTPGLQSGPNPVDASVTASGDYDLDGGSDLGYLVDGDKFHMVLNGFQNPNYSNHLTGSFDPTSPVYFGKVLNRDPSKLQERGHYLYTSYDVPAGLAILDSASANTDSVYLVKGTWATEGNSKEDFNADPTVTKPNFDNWSQKFTTAATPWVTSQKLGDAPKKLFRLHALDDGSAGAGRYKLSIVNVVRSTDTASQYGSFDLQIRSARDTDDKPVVLQTFSRLSLNPGSDRYIARVIGDQHTFFDFEKGEGKQKLVTEGLYPNQSPYVRVEVNEDIENGMMEPTALPVGFRGKSHLSIADEALYSQADGANITLVEPALPLRSNVSSGEGNKLGVDSRLFWGLQTQDVRDTNQRNKEVAVIGLAEQLTKHFPSVGTDSVWSGDSEDADAYNNNEFSLENIWVKCLGGSTSNAVDSTQWAEAVYIRNKSSLTESSGTLNGSVLNDVAGNAKSSVNGWRWLDIAKDFGQSASKRFFKFSVPFEGGWDGLDIFDKEKAAMSDISAIREMDSSGSNAFGGPNGATTAAFRKAIDILAEKSDVDIQILATPGMRSSGITEYAIDKTEERFDALYIMDLPLLDHEENYITKATQEVSVSNTAQALADRNLDTSFAATYFPDVVFQDGQQAVVVAPSVPVLGALSLNDAIAHPWYAPAGFARGALPTTLETAVKLNRTNMDVLYEADINPLTSFPQTGESVVVFGQKTMLQSQSALDRVNVRRLLIDVRRKVRTVASSILFEPNRESTLARFSSLVNPILGRIQAQNGLERYKVVIDTTTTTQQDIENNTIRGKIFLQPTKSVEFISLDFVVGNQGMDV